MIAVYPAHEEKTSPVLGNKAKILVSPIKIKPRSPLMDKLIIKIKKGSAKVKLGVDNKVIKFTYPLPAEEITAGDLNKLISVVEALKR